MLGDFHFDDVAFILGGIGVMVCLIWFAAH